jgi:hypothetical protein
VDTDGNRSTVSRFITPLLLPINPEFSQLSDVRKKTRLLNINAEQDDLLRYHGNFILRTLPHESSGYSIGRVHTRATADYDQRTRILKMEKKRIYLRYISLLLSSMRRLNQILPFYSKPAPLRKQESSMRKTSSAKTRSSTRLGLNVFHWIIYQTN